MDFGLTEEQELIKEAIREFCHTYLDPIAEDLDENSRFPTEVVAQMGEMGWLGMPVPVEYGGSGLDYITYTMVVEEISRSSGAVGVDIAVHTGCAMVINNFGTEEQKRTYLPAMARGQKIGSFCLTEPGAGSDAASINATAVRDGDSYVINAYKTFVTSGPLAGVFLILAKTDPARGAKGISLFIVPGDNPGLKVGTHFNKIGLRASQTSEIILKDCRVPKSNLVGQEGQGLKIGLNFLDHGRIGIAAQAIGIAQAAMEDAIAYAKQRIQFGKPIASQQAIQLKLATMAVKISAARLLAFQAAYRKDQGLPFTQEAAMAKLYASQIANKTCFEALQIHGGNGLMKGVRVERLIRDVRATEIYEGTSEIMNVVIANSLLA